MNENETVTELEIDTEKIEDLKNGDVEITPNEIKKKRAEKGRESMVFRKGLFFGIAGTTAVFLLLIAIAVIVISNVGKGYFMDRRISYKVDLLRAVIDSIYYEDVSDEDIETGIYQGVISATHDKYSAYYTKKDLDVSNEGWEGKFYGIGCTMSKDPNSGFPVVESIEEGSPAEAAGIYPGDRISMVDGQNVYGLTLTEVVRLVRGEEGTEVVITVIHPTGIKEEFTCVRAEIKMDKVRYEQKEDGIGYIRISEFSNVAAEQFESAIEKAKTDKVKGVIVDLRGNPGGDLDTAVEICRSFMPAGLIVYTEDKAGNRMDFECDGSKEWDIPMVVLVDISSASASEIFTAAVKDTGVATVVGTKTYGKGVYQRVLSLPDGSGVKVTAGRFYSPKGECFHDVGIEPDVKVEFDGEAYLKDGTDNQLEKGIEVLKDKIKDAGK